MRKLALGVSILFCVLALGVVFLGVFRVRHILQTTRDQVAVEGVFAFDLVSLDIRSIEQHGVADSGFERLTAPGGYRTGAAFSGKLYLGGLDGLAIYDRSGEQSSGQPRLLRVGLELPPAPIVALASGRIRGEAQPYLIAATRGEGVLFLGENPEDSVRQLRPRDAEARDVTAILPLASGDLLLGTRHRGLLIYNGRTLTTFHPKLADAAVTALAGDEGDFWIGTRNSGVLHWHAGQLDTFDTSNGMPDAQVEDIAVSHAGVFVGTPLGVAVFNQGQLSRVLAKGIFAHAIAVEDDRLTIGTIDEGTREIALKEQRVSRAAMEDDGLKVERFFTAEGTVLAVTDGGLLRQEHSATWQTVLAAGKQLLSDRNISALSFAPDGRLWIGYFDRGVDVLNLKTGNAEHVEDDHVFCVNRIVNDPQRHTVDVATANGLVLFSPDSTAPKERQVLLRQDGLIADQITDVAFSRDGMTLATPAGLTYMTASGAQSLYAFHGLVNNHVYALAAEPTSGRVMAGTLGGISIVEDETVSRNLTMKNSGLKHNWITAILRVPQQEGADHWFVGTYGSGVMQMDADGHISEMEGATREAVINPNAMLETQQHVFAGSLDSGLLVFNRNSQRWSQITAGLPSMNVTALAESNGQIYVGTENGVVHIAETRLP